jgi:hypothetical protein
MTITDQLEILAQNQIKFLRKGGLCVGLVVTKTAEEKGLPLYPEDLRTEEGGQVAGLSRSGVQSILGQFGITRVLAQEGGRTSRGSLGLMKSYVEMLNAAHADGCADLNLAMSWWIEKVQRHFASEGPKFEFDPARSVGANLDQLFAKVEELQRDSGGTNYVGAMLQHLVGAKLDIVLGAGTIQHHGFSVADGATSRSADFEIDGIAIHVTTSPSEALIAKIGANLGSGLKPIIVTLGGSVEGARFLLNKSEWNGRVDVVNAREFLVANVYERSFFQAVQCKETLVRILARYNDIVDECETDPVLKVRL